MLLDPDSSLESTTAGKLFRLRVRVPFSVFQMIVHKFRTVPEWNIRKDPYSKRGRPCPLELKVMSSLYILGRAATYDDAAMVTGLSSTVIATFFHHFIVCMASLYSEWIYPTPEGPKLEDVLKQYETLGFPGCCASTCESEGSWAKLRALLITHYEYAKGDLWPSWQSDSLRLG